jgi:NADH-quinone oxidoreductase subunit G
LNNHIDGVALQTLATNNNGGLQRISDVPIYFADAVVRRAASLQMTHDAAILGVAMHSSELRKLNVRAGDLVNVHQGKARVRLVARADDSMPVATARVAAGHFLTAELGAMFGTIIVEAIEVGDRA